MTFTSLLDRRAEMAPDGPAVADSRQSLDNAGLLRRVRAVAAQLDGLGVGRGDVVAAVLANRVEFVVLMFAAWRCGASITPVNPASTSREVVRQLDDSRAALVVIDDDAEAPDAHCAVLAVSGLSTEVSATESAVVDDDSAIALLIYTSGTTGAPKGVMLDHRNIAAMAEMSRSAIGLTESDRCLLILPLFHVNGIVVSVLTPLSAGASVVIADRFDPRTFFADVERHRPTYFSGVPTIFSMLVALPDSVQPDTSSIRFAFCGAAPAPSALLDHFEERYGFPLIEGYGLSEGTCASTLNPIAGERKAGTVGVALPGQKIRIVDVDGSPVPTGSAGEVVIRGANVMRGYLGRPDDTARTVIGGWLHTGDIGRLDDDGYLVLVGRSKDLIIRGGENIYPKEIEDVLTGDPTVMSAAVIGMPDDRWGEVVVAFVEPTPDTSPDVAGLYRLCESSLARFKRPTTIQVVTSMPRNAVGKIDKKALAASQQSAVGGLGDPEAVR
ncbi:class I adenylate-forming enzyme family protein [Williamsia sp. M5A3_1d]